jgi:hypothetical protein
MTPPGRFSRSDNRAAQARPARLRRLPRAHCRWLLPRPAARPVPAPPPSPATGSPRLSHHKTVTRRPGPGDEGPWPPVRPDGAAVSGPAQEPTLRDRPSIRACLLADRTRQPGHHITQIGMISAATGVRSCRIAGVAHSDIYAPFGILIRSSVDSSTPWQHLNLIL